MKQKKEVRITLRLTQEQYDSIAAKAETAQMPVGAYVRAAALRHRVVVIDGLKEITHELKGIGRSINQLVVLCNMGRIKEVHLGDAWQSLSQVYLKLQELTDREVR
ncbi:plasmid mobilization relaxosome protein MobC [Dysosmobacter sp. Marseille-Q4140]|nr:plasmid mobilization relaxosome protein MobC [Dysosmobacter sp. Marseille-Q4140]